jgi:uncharacterized protein
VSVLLELRRARDSMAHLQIGRAYARQGDTVKAKAAYQDFLTLWKNADSDIPILAGVTLVGRGWFEFAGQNGRRSDKTAHMAFSHTISRRAFMRSASLATAGVLTRRLRLPAVSTIPGQPPLKEFSYANVTLNSDLHEKQLHETHAVLMGLSEDSLLKPFRQMAGQPAPGVDLGGWYHYDPDYDPDTVVDGFAPGAPFGQWVSALARAYAITGSRETRDKVLRLNRLYAKTISDDFYGEKNRFPAYCYDKLVCGLMDSHLYVADPDARSILDCTTTTALPHLPGKAIEHDQRWRKSPSAGYMWDESYTISENLFLAYQRGLGDRYLELAIQYLDDQYYDPLANGIDVLADRHAYSYVNSLSSAMQAYLTLGSTKHLRAATNAFEMLKAQSFATGGWGPDELLRAPGSGDLAASLTNTHSSFETPCGAYAHFKLTRYLLRVTRDSRYGDSMERVMYNTILGAKPLLADGSTFYYADFSFEGRKIYKPNHWPCCSGTLPQVAADYRINTYFCEADGLYVNLYIPSIVRWTRNGARVSFTQRSGYPFDGRLTFEITVSWPTEFAIHLRIPEWAESASIFVNGKPVAAPPLAGGFLSIRRAWKTGDCIEMDLPMTMRLEPIDAGHPQIVALLCGPLVLFAITDTSPMVTAGQLLAAKRVGEQSWQVDTNSGPLTMLPFTAIADQQYSTYLIVS